MSEDKRDSFGRIQEEPSVFVGGFNNEPGLTPPADDVREALIEGVKLDARNLMRSDPRVWHEALESALDKTLPGFWAAATQVRPRGTVTHAEVEAAAGAICQAAEGESLSDVRMGMREQYMREARAALEAARNA